MKVINAAFPGDGLRSVKGLGEYSVFEEKGICHCVKFSGASMGSVIAICLAAGKSPVGIRDFLADNSEDFSKWIIGNKKIEDATNEYLGDMLFQDLSMDCIVAVTPALRRKTVPHIITRENSGELTAGRVAACSSALPGMFLPQFAKVDGKYAWFIDGGILYNPPLNDKADENFVFSSRKGNKNILFSWDKRRIEQERKADVTLKPRTDFGVLGKRDDVFAIYDEGREYALSYIEAFYRR